MMPTIDPRRLRTVHLVPLTAYNRQGRLNAALQAEHVTQMAAAGLRVFLPGAGTSEFHNLTVEENLTPGAAKGAHVYGYSGMGNHQVSVADVDFDGKDEIVYGAMCVDDDGKVPWVHAEAVAEWFGALGDHLVEGAAHLRCAPGEPPPERGVARGVGEELEVERGPLAVARHGVEGLVGGDFRLTGRLVDVDPFVR